jgi:hypothetical protein
MMKPRGILVAAIPTLIIAVGYAVFSAWSERPEPGTLPLKPIFVDGARYDGVEITGIILLSGATHNTIDATDEFLDSGEYALTLSHGPGPGAQAARAKTGILGILQLSDGRWFVGDVLGSEPNGWGVFSQPNGTKLEGKWRYGTPYKISGRVVLPDGVVEEGTWDFVRSTGSGTITWRDGHTYAGSWKITSGDSPELPDGTGTMSWPDGHKYAGPFRNGQMHGWGTMTQTDGKTVDGLWRHGEFVMSRIGR